MADHDPTEDIWPDQPDTEPVDEQAEKQQQESPPKGDKVVKRAPVGVRSGVAPAPTPPGRSPA